MNEIIIIEKEQFDNIKGLKSMGNMGDVDGMGLKATLNFYYVKVIRRNDLPLYAKIRHTHTQAQLTQKMSSDFTNIYKNFNRN